MKTSKRGWSPAKLATTGALVSTGTVFVRYKMNAPAAAAKDAMMAQGLMYSFVALCGNTAASLLRKQVSRVSSVRPAEQVGLATAIQGVFAVAYCAHHGLLSASGAAVSAAFLVPAVASSAPGSDGDRVQRHFNMTWTPVSGSRETLGDSRVRK